MAIINGTPGDDNLTGTNDDDVFTGGTGSDTFTGLRGNDTAVFNVSTDGADSIDLGRGNDIVEVGADAPGQVRLTFTSSQAGNNNPLDSNTMANQDGGLAARLQAEDGADGLTGPVSRFDDEGITFVSTTPGLTFDVRDLVSGTARGSLFESVALGTNLNDRLMALGDRTFYGNGGMGNDWVTGGNADDFLVGGSGDDTLRGGRGNDSFIGGGGNDTIQGSAGDDLAIFNVSTDGADSVDLGTGADTVSVSAATAGQIRLSFTSAQVGNDYINDSNSMANQDGGLAVRLQAEDPTGLLTGAVSRFDDEGITFVASTPGVTFDVRDLVSGVARGDQFQVVALGTVGSDIMTAAQPARPYYFNGGMGNDTISGGDAADFLVGGAGDDVLTGGRDDDSFIAGGGNDTIHGGEGNDTAIFNVSTDGADTADLGTGADTVNVSAAAAGQIRLAFTSSQVGNNQANDSNSLANQDGGLAVRLQAEDGADGLTGAISRFDDEGITFIASTPGVTFDVRDLVSGVARGNQFEIVTLGTSARDTLNALQASRAYYINAGAGNDTVTGGDASDFLVGGSGNDALRGGAGDDSFIGGADNDTITGGEGDDTAIVNVSTDGADKVDLGAGADTVNVSAAAPGQIRVTFTSAQVGNNQANDSNTMANQDGGLAVRLQAENTSGNLAGTIGRYDDEGITFVASTPGITFDVRDLVSGVARGDQFEVVALGTGSTDTMVAVQNTRAYYFNAGMGDDSVTGGNANDFLVGGAGNDVLRGGRGNDSFIGGGGNDVITGSVGDDTAIFNISTDGADSVDLGVGTDMVNVSAAAPGQIRLTFTSSQVGNNQATDSNSMANQDGGLAVRMQAEDTMGNLGGPVSRFDDEGVTFVASMPGVTFDVRDLVSGVARGDLFEVAVLGTNGADMLTAVQSTRAYYVNAGMGDDTVVGGNADDFLVGGAGNDVLSGGLGRDSFIGGAGTDTFVYTATAQSGATAVTRDIIIDFMAGDRIDLSGIDAVAATASDDDFAFVGSAAFTNTAGELRQFTDGANTVLEGDINGDGMADFQIQANGMITFAGTDFLL